MLFIVFGHGHKNVIYWLPSSKIHSKKKKEYECHLIGQINCEIQEKNFCLLRGPMAQDHAMKVYRL